MGWYYHYDKTKEKYSALIDQLQTKRESLCGIGTRKVKLRLNKLAKSNLTALLYRKALEIEDKNIQAKAWPEYREKYYEEKSNLINELINICLDNKIKVGYSSEEIEHKISIDEYDDFGHIIINPYYEYETETIYIIYFELPCCEQISWHSPSKPQCPLYDGIWDEQRNSTLPKLEKAILEVFPEIIQ